MMEINLKKYIFPCFLLFIANVNPLLAQAAEKVYMISEVKIKPKYVGGENELHQFISQNISNKVCFDADDSPIDKINILFTIEKDGAVSDICINNKTAADYNSCEKEQIKALELMPKWTPAMQNGQPVRVQFHLPIRLHFN